MAPAFNVGQIYNRRKAIHVPFGGQRQSGIVTPAKYPLVFIFTGRGKRHGYHDEISPDGTVRYFGEGQKGDMTLTKGNKAIANHAADGKDLQLFEMLGKGQVQFCGTFNCTGYEYKEGQDQSGNSRQALVFYLVPVAGGPGELASDAPAPKIGAQELRKQAMAAAGPAQVGTFEKTTQTYRKRGQIIRQYVLARAAGVCESCQQAAPFATKAGALYLEPHHIRRLSDDGPDDPHFMAGICPNCHREIHYGVNGQTRNAALQAVVTAKENVLDDQN
jgi:5-methylcytosine-specific restriction protein A